MTENTSENISSLGEGSGEVPGERPVDMSSSPWNKSTEEVLEQYNTSKEGLEDNEVKNRIDRFGLNKLRETKERSRWNILVSQFKSLLILLLSLAAVISFFFVGWIEGVSILAVLLISAAIGFVTESRAVQSMEALQEMTKINTKVRRDGEVEEIHAERLVPGDIVVLNSGDIVPADLRVIESSKLQADESTLTGESVPVSKSVEALEEDVPLAERKNMLYKGTFLTRGTAEALVVSTGLETELGEISESIVEAEEEQTPLEERLDELAQKLIPLLVVIAIIVAISGIIRGEDPILMIKTAIALAVATIPEGLPIVATLALARGMWRMADQNALINRLSSVETLGSTNIICTDKTGTLTENRMTVNQYSAESADIDVTGTGLDVEGGFREEESSVEVSENEVLRRSLEVGVLCSNASYEESDGEKEVMGDPMEVSLLIAGLKAGIDRDELLESMPEAREVSFDPTVKMMATFHEMNGSYRTMVKGAPEAVLEKCSHVLEDGEKKELTEEMKEKWLERSDRMAKDGLRVLALAEKEVDSAEVEPYKDLTFLSLVGMMDPPREEVKEAIKTCQDAGIRIIMVTGDHASTARNIGFSVGLVESEDAEVVQGDELRDPEDLRDEEKERFIDTSIFARVSPDNKLDLIELHQKNGSIVAMTGDGVNDAPALKKADIGIAMGERGTQVAQEAADMILKDDNFSTITTAVEQGRIIFRNIRKFVIYLLSCNLSELITIFLATILGYPLPLLALQILFLNVVNDIFPAFALGVGEGSEGIMDQSPRNPEEPVITRENWIGIGSYGISISIVTLIAFVVGSMWFGMYANGSAPTRVVTISFLTLAFAQLWHVFNMRDVKSGLFRNEITANKYVWGALGLCSVILLAATYLPGISEVLSLEAPDLKSWMLILGMSLVPLLLGQAWKVVRSFRESR